MVDDFTKNFIDLLQIWDKVVFGVADYKSDVLLSNNKMPFTSPLAKPASRA